MSTESMLAVAAVVIACLVQVIVVQGLIHMRERQRLVRHNDELLNRLMSRDFSEYAAASRALPTNWRSIAQYMAKREKADGRDEEQEAEKDDGLGIPVV